MSPRAFVQETSIVKRLRTVMFAIAIFFVIGFFGNYLSSQGFLRGLQEIHNTNIVLNLLSQTTDGLDTSAKGLEKLKSEKDLRDIEFAFNESQEIVNSSHALSKKYVRKGDPVLSHLLEATEAIRNFEVSAKNIIKNHRSFSPEALEAELLVLGQYLSEARESLRDSQIKLRRSSNRLFSSIYRKRFVPLIVTIVLSLFFFTFVVTYCFSLARRIEQSLKGLTEATDAVSAGDLAYEAKINERDEFGNLTNAFNSMVHSLRTGRQDLDYTIDQIKKLQRITAALSEAVTVDQVCDITLKIGAEALGATGGSVAILSRDGATVEIKKMQGHDSSVLDKWGRFPLSWNAPVCETIIDRKAIYATEPRDLKRFTQVSEDQRLGAIKALVSLPLIAGNSCIGAVSFSFPEPRTLDQNEMDFILAVVRQAAQALHRSLLYDNAREAIQSRDDFLSIASHELKTPLTPLKLQLQMLGRQIKKGTESFSPEKISTIVDNSDRQLGRLSKLIEDLLDVSRITSGKLTLNLEKVNLALLIRDIISQYGQQLKEALKKVEFTCSDEVEVQIDKLRIEQVLINLLTNAAKYAPGKPIKVSLEEREKFVLISVRDQGPGIAPENQKRIFDRFERVRETDNIGGLGLGLYISQQIVRAHNGEIFVNSLPGDGATFFVKLPLVQDLEVREELV